MEETLLFQGISRDSVLAMMDCFKPERRSFRKGETILVYSQDLEHLCLLLSGRAHLYCMDSDGDYALLSTMAPGIYSARFLPSRLRTGLCCGS